MKLQVCRRSRQYVLFCCRGSSGYWCRYSLEFGWSYFEAPQTFYLTQESVTKSNQSLSFPKSGALRSQEYEQKRSAVDLKRTQFHQSVLLARDLLAEPWFLDGRYQHFHSIGSRWSSWILLIRISSHLLNISNSSAFYRHWKLHFHQKLWKVLTFWWFFRSYVLKFHHVKVDWANSGFNFLILC